MRSSRLSGRRLAAAGLVAVTVLGGVVATTSTASAQAGRRVCKYGEVSENRDGSGKLISRSIWGVNYRKDGGCPTNTNGRTRDNGATSTFTGKATCEAVANDLHSNYRDICDGMNSRDDVYLIDAWVGDNGATTGTDFYSYGRYNAN